MKTPPKLLLNQILFPLGSSSVILSSRTEISVERLEQMFEKGDSTEAELERVAQALERPVDLIRDAFNYQAGSFNQNGSNQRQKVDMREKPITIKIKKLKVFIQVVSPSSKPVAEDPNDLLVPIQQWNANHALLGEESLQVGRSLTSGTHGF